MTVRLWDTISLALAPARAMSLCSSLRMAPTRSFEFRCHKLSGARLHFPDSFLKIVHTRADASH